MEKITIIGSNGLFMVGSHVAHDCKVGDNVIFVNGAVIGGHVEIMIFVILVDILLFINSVELENMQ